MVRNNGGIVDTEGVKVKDIEVIFLVDGSQLGSVVTIDSLAYGEEVALSSFFGTQEELMTVMKWVFLSRYL